MQRIIEDVRSRGDACIRELGLKFDGVAPDPLRVPPDEIVAALNAIPDDVRSALEAAAASIDAFHRSGPDARHVHEDRGITVEAVRQPVDRAGLYVPGGRASYPSTVLMTALPARAAGVPSIALCVPPTSDGHIAPVTLAAAAVAQVDEVYAVGGAQAIAAMAYGTDSIQPVDVIVGPGNVYVALAKQQVTGVVGVPAAFAGPSEIVVVADDTAPPDHCAIDLIVQAEHGPDGLSWLIAWDEEVVAEIEQALATLVAAALRRSDIEASFANGGHVALVRDEVQAIEVANLIAPEHLQIMTARPQELVGSVRHAGAVFCGSLAPASLGDYIAGPSHVLPVAGTARFGGALGIEDFCKHLHIVTVTEEGFDRVADAVEILAEAEGLDAHAESVRLRKQR